MKKNFENSLLDISSFMPKLYQKPSAWLGHLPFAAWIMREVSPNILVELGTHWGLSYFTFCQSALDANLAAKCYAVDTWQGDDHTEKYGEEVWHFVNDYNQKNFTVFSQLLRMTFDDAVGYFSDGSIELLHIDGLHTYEAVKHDFETWLPKLTPGAVVLFHDINVRERGFGVWQLWEELQAVYPNNLEFVHSHGLGVLQLNNAPNKQLAWLKPDSAEKQQLKNYFSSLGSWQKDRFDLSDLKRQCVELNQAVAEYNGQVANLNATNEELNKVIVDQNAHIASLIQDNKNRDRRISALYNSASWRLTKPVRFISHQLRRVNRAIELAGPAVKLGGGVTSTTLKAIKLFSKDGVDGLKRGFRLAAKSQQPNIKNVSGDLERNNYAEWVRLYDTVTDEVRSILISRINQFSDKPLISVVMPVYNPNPEWLIEAIDSVRKQIYPHWELCIADDASTDTAIRTILDRYAKEDPRIKVDYRKDNGHISTASNSALDLVMGEWVALLDHDDLLSEQALFWVANAISQNPGVHMIYSDEDRIDESGNRFCPYFKCDWNIDLFYSQNMFSHLGVYRTDILKAIGGFRVGFEGSQDYDLALRCIERAKPTHIYHIPRVLYHWRVHSESTASSIKAKPYATIAAEEALNEHFQRTKIQARVQYTGIGYRVTYALPTKPPKVSLIITTNNGLQPIRNCIESILKRTAYPNYEILIIENKGGAGKSGQYADLQRTENRIRVIYQDLASTRPALINAAVKQAKGEVVAILNGSLEVICPEWLLEMVSIAIQPGVGAIGAKLLLQDNTIQNGGLILGFGEYNIAGFTRCQLPGTQNGYFGRGELINSFSAIGSDCLVIQTSKYEEVGGFNERELKVAFFDVDFCLRLREIGYRNVYTPYAELYLNTDAACRVGDNHEKQLQIFKDIAYMKERWGDLLIDDPAFSPNLSLENGRFNYSWPPRLEILTDQSQAPEIKLDRVEKALFLIDKNGLGLEIGPSHNPLAPKKQGFNVHVLDHASAEDLKAKYQGHDIVFDNIEEVDFVWQGEPLHESVGKEECYDWIIASHVIEHTPDMITFLQECERLLKPNGVLSLVIPDKRYCFDYFNPVTWTGELLDAYEQKRKRPSPGKVFEHFAGACNLNDQFAWGKGSTGVFSIGKFDDARNAWNQAISSSDYIDVHNWRFTPSSFRLILADLQALGLCGLSIAKEFDTAGCEFFVTLRKTDPIAIFHDRLDLLKAASIEGHGI